MDPKLEKIERIALAVLPGLLASGHYTRVCAAEEPMPDGESPEPEILREDHGDDWKIDGYNRRAPIRAVRDAFTIANDFLKEIEAEEDFHEITTKANASKKAE